MREINGQYQKQTYCKRGHEKTPENTSTAGACKTCMRQWRKDHPEACRNIGKEQYAEMYANQKGLCILPSCGQLVAMVDIRGGLKKIRGLMCNRHNLALGLFSNDPKLLLEAADYLEKFNGQQ
jgi:hypothetical protein